MQGAQDWQGKGVAVGAPTGKEAASEAGRSARKNATASTDAPDGKAAPIRNVVFDNGNVLMTFDPMSFCRPYATSEEDAQAICQALFKSPYWALLDADAIGEETLMMLAQAHLPARLHEPAREAFVHWHEHHPPIQATCDLARRLHQAGLGVYLLSNAGRRFQKIKETLPCLDVLDGWVVSAYEKVMKPDPRIYQILCDRYGLVAAETLFVDDFPDNLLGAQEVGMQTHLFVGADELEAYLRERGLDF